MTNLPLIPHLRRFRHPISIPASRTSRSVPFWRDPVIVVSLRVRLHRSISPSIFFVHVCFSRFVAPLRLYGGILLV